MHNVIYYVMCICVFVDFCILCAPIAVKQIAPPVINKGIDCLIDVCLCVCLIIWYLQQ